MLSGRAKETRLPFAARTEVPARPTAGSRHNSPPRDETMATTPDLADIDFLDRVQRDR